MLEGRPPRAMEPRETPLGRLLEMPEARDVERGAE
jgi:hypothetical protein